MSKSGFDDLGMEVLPPMLAWGLSITFWLPVLAHLRDGGYPTWAQTVSCVAVFTFLIVPMALLMIVGWCCDALSVSPSETFSEFVLQAFRAYGFAVFAIGGIAFASIWAAYFLRSLA